MTTDAEARRIVDAYCRAHDYALVTREQAAEAERIRALLDHRTADHDAVVAERDAAIEQVAELEAERAGALELHRPKSGDIGPECTACGSEEDPEPWPCSTMLALDYSRDLSDR